MTGKRFHASIIDCRRKADSLVIAGNWPDRMSLTINAYLVIGVLAVPLTTPYLVSHGLSMRLPSPRLHKQEVISRCVTIPCEQSQYARERCLIIKERCGQA